MKTALGIDTGGTYTDAVLVDQSTGSVLGSAKALTTHYDLSIGIAEALSLLWRDAHARAPSRTDPSHDLGLVGLSTTLATNAIVEGQGSPVCLLLVGYDHCLVEEHGFSSALVTDDVVYVGGGHDADGNEVAQLDCAAIQEAVLARRDRVSGFAVSGYFGVRNPTHELRARDLIQQTTAGWDGTTGGPLPVTCGHELTTRLDSVRRATTVALNARLVPLLRNLVAVVRRTLDDLGVQAPLMIVKGDGSLVSAEWAMRRPIETILSGPAASVVGASHIAGKRNVWVVDVGGTTTDIAALHDGRPRISAQGAQVGGWRTMVEAADVHTVGLGGDSHVRLDGNTMPGADGLTIGPRRVVPLSLLGAQFPEIVTELERQLDARQRMRLAGQFAVCHRYPQIELSQGDAALLQALSAGPRSLVSMAESSRYGALVVRQLDGLAARQLVRYAAFAPTDALHVLGRFAEWNVEAARLGAELLASQMGIPASEICERVVDEVSNRVTTELVTKVLGDEESRPRWPEEPAAVALLARAIGSVPGSGLECRLSLRWPVVAVGAPVTAYLPRSAEQLGTELIIPPHADVANAIGAVAGSVVQRARALIRPINGGESFRLHLADGTHDFAHPDDAVAHAQRELLARVTAMAQEAGAVQVEVRQERVDRTAPLQADWGQEVYVQTELTFTAVGRPGLAQDTLPTIAP